MLYSGHSCLSIQLSCCSLPVVINFCLLYGLKPLAILMQMMPLSGDSFCLRWNQDRQWGYLSLIVWVCPDTQSGLCMHKQLSSFLYVSFHPAPHVISISSCSICDDPFHPAPHVMIHFTLPHRTTTIACSTMKRAETQAVLQMRYVHNNYCWTILPDSQGQACTKDLWFSFYWEMVIVMNFNA